MPTVEPQAQADTMSITSQIPTLAQNGRQSGTRVEQAEEKNAMPWEARWT